MRRTRRSEHGLALPRVQLELVPILPGGKVGRPRRIRTNSWLRNMAHMVMSCYREGQSSGATDITGTGKTIHHGTSYTRRFRANSTAYGVLVGTGETAVDRDNFALASEISNGDADGQLRRQGMGFDGPHQLDGGYRWTLERQFDNNGSVPVTIREVGCSFNHNTTGATNETANFLVLRDLVPGGHTVPAGGSVIMRYHLDWEV